MPFKEKLGLKSERLIEHFNYRAMRKSKSTLPAALNQTFELFIVIRPFPP